MSDTLNDIQIDREVFPVRGTPKTDELCSMLRTMSEVQECVSKFERELAAITRERDDLRSKYIRKGADWLMYSEEQDAKLAASLKENDTLRVRLAGALADKERLLGLLKQWSLRRTFDKFNSCLSNETHAAIDAARQKDGM